MALTGLPPYLRAFTPAAMDRVLKEADGGTVSIAGADFTPSHMLVRELAGTVYDTNRSDPWDLVSEGPEARRGLTTYGSFRGQQLELTYGSAHRYRAKTLGAFNFGTQSWSIMFPWRFDARGDGGFFLGNVRGPNSTDPWYPTETHYGADRGWGVSANGDGGFGAVMYSTSDNTANWINMDTVANSYDAADGRWRMFEAGYNAAAKTMWATIAKRGDEGGGIAFCAQATTGLTGDITSPDYFVTGAMQYGVEASFLAGAIGLPWCVFEGTPALNRWSSRLTSLPILQAQLEAYEP